MLRNKFQSFIEGKVKKDEFSGTVLVTKDSNYIFEFSCGYANHEKKIPNSILPLGDPTGSLFERSLAFWEKLRLVYQEVEKE